MAVGIQRLDSAFQTAKDWLLEVEENLPGENENKAYQVTKAVLSVIRDRLSPQEAFQFASQFPLVIKGMYFDGWNPVHNPLRIRTPEEFIEEVSYRITDADEEEATRAVFKMLKNRISEGEINDIKANFPEELNELWEMD